MKPVLFLFMFLLPLSLWSTETSDWESAETAYSQGEFALALTFYQGLKLKEGTSAALEYNIGNTFMRLNRIPEAMAHYRRAQWLAPHDPDIRANLERAQSLQQAQLPDLPVGRRIAGLLSTDVWQILLVLSAWVLGLTGLLRRQSPVLRTAATWILPAAALTLLLSLGNVWLLRPQSLSSEAVARPDTLISRFEPLSDSTEHFSVTGGSVVQVLEQVRDWTRIRVGEKTGWVRTGDLIPVALDTTPG